MPGKHPLLNAGVSSRPCTTTNTLDPVPSHSSPRVLANKASPAPSSCARASATTLSAYDVVLRPATALRSFLAHGTTTAAVVRGHCTASPTATTSVPPAP